MVDQAGHSATAIAALSTALSARHAGVADADRTLAEVVAAAHAATVEGLRGLDVIETDIESAVAQQDTLALDTPAGSHQLHQFLLAKHHEIIDIVEQAAADAESKRAVLHGLSGRYSAISAPSTT